jgi:malonate-semialdehyde dehydrogenase (acetylating)/methylmalonate-semialdehyde dehydrogenase
VVNAILDHPDIAGVSFVGSSPTAKYIYERCGATGKRVQALGGAKNIVAVMPDAKLDPAMPSMITSFYGCTGQRCLSGAILAPVGDAAEKVIDKFTFAAKSVRMGDGLDEKTPWAQGARAPKRVQALKRDRRGSRQSDGRTPMRRSSDRLLRRTHISTR